MCLSFFFFLYFCFMFIFNLCPFLATMSLLATISFPCFFSPNMLCSWFDLVRFASAYLVTMAGFVGDQSM